MNPCENCIHLPICRIREDYRQLLVDIEPFKTKNPAVEVMVNCKYFRIKYDKSTRGNYNKIINGNEVMNTL